MKRLSKAIQSCSVLLKGPPVAVVNVGGKLKESTSPKATGVAGQFSMGKTRSGKSVHSYSHHDKNASWSHHDHMDAYRAHAKHLGELDPSDTHKGLIHHHKAAMQHHYKMAYAHQVEKARHHHAKAGKTRSGKHIYSNKHAHHSDYAKFSKHDHVDASHAHHKRAMRLLDVIASVSEKGNHKFAKFLQKIMQRHATLAHGHHSAAHNGRH